MAYYQFKLHNFFSGPQSLYPMSVPRSGTGEVNTIILDDDIVMTAMTTKTKIIIKSWSFNTIQGGTKRL